jgi:hypothetical protein
VEEQISRKNGDIRKSLMDTARLRCFALDRTTARDAVLDFLRLDQYVHVTDWLAQNMSPVPGRAAQGKTLPVQQVRLRRLRRTDVVTARLAPGALGVTLQDLQLRGSWDTDDFVRFSPVNSFQSGQSTRQLLVAGMTCTILRINWQSVLVILRHIYSPGALPYVLRSTADALWGSGGFSDATIDASPSDFVGQRVERRLAQAGPAPAERWLVPISPAVPRRTPLSPAQRRQYRQLLRRLILPNGARLVQDQQRAVLAGLGVHLQLMQGPTSTGKTMTTAVAALIRAMARLKAGDVVLLGAPTHRAIDVYSSTVYSAPTRHCRHRPAHLGLPCRRCSWRRSYRKALWRRVVSPAFPAATCKQSGSCGGRVSRSLAE